MCVERVVGAGFARQGSWVRNSDWVVGLRPAGIKPNAQSYRTSLLPAGACPPLIDHTSHLHDGLHIDLTPTHYGSTAPCRLETETLAILTPLSTHAPTGVVSLAANHIGRPRFGTKPIAALLPLHRACHPCQISTSQVSSLQPHQSSDNMIMPHRLPSRACLLLGRLFHSRLRNERGPRSPETQ